LNGFVGIIAIFKKIFKSIETNSLFTDLTFFNDKFVKKKKQIPQLSCLK